MRKGRKLVRQHGACRRHKQHAYVILPKRLHCIRGEISQQLQVSINPLLRERAVVFVDQPVPLADEYIVDLPAAAQQLRARLERDPAVAHRELVGQIFLIPLREGAVPNRFGGEGGKLGQQPVFVFRKHFHGPNEVPQRNGSDQQKKRRDGEDCFQFGFHAPPPLRNGNTGTDCSLRPPNKPCSAAAPRRFPQSAAAPAGSDAVPKNGRTSGAAFPARRPRRWPAPREE